MAKSELQRFIREVEISTYRTDPTLWTRMCVEIQGWDQKIAKENPYHGDRKQLQALRSILENRLKAEQQILVRCVNEIDSEIKNCEEFLASKVVSSEKVVLFYRALRSATQRLNRLGGDKTRRSLLAEKLSGSEAVKKFLTERRIKLRQLAAQSEAVFS